MASVKEEMPCAGAKDIGKLSTARGGGTAPDVLRAPRRHAGTISEDEESMDNVEHLRGSEEDADGLPALQDSAPGNSRKNPDETEKNEIRSPEVYHGDSVVSPLLHALPYPYNQLQTTVGTMGAVRTCV